MKKFLLYLVSPLLLFAANYSRAQNTDQPVHIAIIPFTASGYGRADITAAVQNEVTSCFANKGRFFLMDRAVTEKLKQELESAKDNASVYAQVVAEQGHLANAEFIITGIVSPVQIQTSVYNNVTTYVATVRIAIQMDKVETGRVFYNTPISIQSIGCVSEAAATDNVLCRFGTQFKGIVRSLFSPPMLILEVVKDKKGVPQKVRVNAGTDMFDSGKDDACGSILTSWITGKKKIWLEVYTEHEISGGGKTYKTTQVFGTLKVDAVDGETSVCDVSTGAEEIKAMLDKGIAPMVRLQASN